MKKIFQLFITALLCSNSYAQITVEFADPNDYFDVPGYYKVKMGRFSSIIPYVCYINTNGTGPTATFRNPLFTLSKPDGGFQLANSNCTFDINDATQMLYMMYVTNKNDVNTINNGIPAIIYTPDQTKIGQQETHYIQCYRIGRNCREKTSTSIFTVNQGTFSVTTEKPEWKAEAESLKKICTGDEVIDLTKLVNTKEVIFPSENITGIRNSTTIDPAKVKPGKYELKAYKHYANGLFYFPTLTIEIIESPVITIANAPKVLYQDDPVQLLRAEPNAGKWAGSGIDEQGNITPARATLGKNTYTYTLESKSGCIISKEVLIEIKESTIINIYPTSFKDRITLDYNTRTNEEVIVEFLDNKGNYLFTEKRNAIAGANKWILTDFSKMYAPNTFYYVNIKSKSKVAQFKMFKL